MRIAGFRETSLFDGRGINFVIFVQGCKHHCTGCHNPVTWDFNGGREMTLDEIKAIIRQYIGFISGITFSGGDPVEQLEEVGKLAEWAHELQLTTTLYTGYKLDDIKQHLEMAHIDYVIDGKYIDELHSFDYPFRGSSNQKFYKHTSDGSWEVIE